MLNGRPSNENPPVQPDGAEGDGVSVTPTDQTEFGEKAGNCFAACVASLLDMPIESVPNFCAAEGDWWGKFQNWLAERGLFAVEMRTRNLIVTMPPFAVHAIISGASPRGKFDHSVVGISEGDSMKVCHDPHPSRAGLEGEPSHVMFICQLRARGAA